VRPFPLVSADLLAAQEDNLRACIRCGACLPVCPTYLLTGIEEESPRGRIAMALALHEGYLPMVTEDFVRHEENCLLCEACTAVCPAGVQMDVFGIALRAAMGRKRPWMERLARSIGFALLANLSWLRAGVRLLHWVGPLRGTARRLGILRLFGLSEADALLPSLFARPLVARGQQWRPVGPVRGQAALFAGCLMSTMFAEVDRATARVLSAHGWQVTVLTGQGCCGSLHAHEGELQAARALARRNIEAFEGDPASAIVVNAAGCGSMLKGYGRLLEDDPAYAARARAFSSRVRDVTEFLEQQDPPGPVAPLNLTVTLQDPCHLAHAQGIQRAPRTLIRRLPAVTFREMAEPSLCCGSAGVYNLTHKAKAQSLGQRKAANVQATGAVVVVTANPGCHLHLQATLAGSGVAVRHIIELLDESFREGGAYVGIESGE